MTPIAAQGPYKTPDDEEKKMKRVIRNRKAAKASYERRKKMIGNLHATVADLKKENREVKAENEDLKKQLEEMKRKVSGLEITLGKGPSRGSLIDAEPDLNHPSMAIDELASLKRQKLFAFSLNNNNNSSSSSIINNNNSSSSNNNNNNNSSNFTSRIDSIPLVSSSRQNSKMIQEISFSRESSMTCSSFSRTTSSLYGPNLSRSNSLVPPAFFRVASCASTDFSVDSILPGGNRLMATV